MFLFTFIVVFPKLINRSCVPQKKKTLFKNPHLPYMCISLYLEMKQEVKKHPICINVVFRCQFSAL